MIGFSAILCLYCHFFFLMCDIHDIRLMNLMEEEIGYLSGVPVFHVKYLTPVTRLSFYVSILHFCLLPGHWTSRVLNVFALLTRPRTQLGFECFCYGIRISLCGEKNGEHKLWMSLASPSNLASFAAVAARSWLTRLLLYLFDCSSS